MKKQAKVLFTIYGTCFATGVAIKVVEQRRLRKEKEIESYEAVAKSQALMNDLQSKSQFVERQLMNAKFWEQVLIED